MINKILNEDIDIDKILVVTFTNAAASEMRERILDALYKKIDEEPDNEKLQRQITLLNKASICTIDSFCLDVLRNNFYELDISPNFRIADNTEIELLKQEAVEELFDQKYEEEDEDFLHLIKTYTSYKDDSSLKELVQKIYTYIQSNPFPEKWLEEKVEMFNVKDKLDSDFAENIWGQNILEELEEELIDSLKILENTYNMLIMDSELEPHAKVVANDINELQKLKENINSWEKAYLISQNINFLRWPSNKVTSVLVKEKAKDLRTAAKDNIKNKIKKLMIFSSKEAYTDIYDMYETLVKLKELIINYDKMFSKLKREKNILDFGDIEHLTLNILVKINEDGSISKTDVAKRYQDKYVEVAIDEYQDSNLVQEYILTTISNNKNVFMVGDVKQSIYKFRQACPRLFQSKYDTYKLKQNKEDEDDLKIKLFANFRSRKEVLDFTNLIFENIMSKELGEIEYDEGEFLINRASFEPTKENVKTEIHLIDLADKEEIKKENYESENEEETKEDDEERIEDIEVEARFVASKIKELVESKFQVYDMKLQKFREIKYKDIVVLLRNTKIPAAIFEKELINSNIPVFSDASSEYLDSIEIQTIMSVLKVIDNPMQDIPLVTVLRSSIGGFSDNDLVKIRLSDKYDKFYNSLIRAKIGEDKELKIKIEKFLEKIDTWRIQKEYLSLDELIWKIYNDTGFYNYVGLLPNGGLRQANLKILFERAKQYEKVSFKGLFNFITFVEKLRIGNGDMGSAKLMGENENVVRIMSIHKSKGLEFPIVFLSNTGRKINMMDLNNNILLHEQYGIGVKHIDYERQLEYDTLSKMAIKNILRTENISEEMRVLYVALTRAKEKLYLVGMVKDFEGFEQNMLKEIERYEKTSQKLNPILVKKYITYIEWIYLVYLYNKDKMADLVNVNVHNKKDIISKTKKQETGEIDTIKDLEKIKVSKEELEEIAKNLEQKYNYINSTVIPTKTSVTEIKRKEMEQDEEKFIEDKILDKSKMPDIKLELPKFLNEEKEYITGASKGTLIHLCMQNLEMNKEYELSDIKELIEKLQANGLINEIEKKSININKIYNFTKNIIWKDMQKAKLVEREKPFYMNVLAKEIYDVEAEENILTQGIIDVYYIDKDNNLILLDYKTDYVEKEEELVKKYKIQLDLYKRALEEALNKKVYKTYIYSTYLDKEIEL